MLAMSTAMGTLASCSPVDKARVLDKDPKHILVHTQHSSPPPYNDFEVAENADALIALPVHRR
jgi:hypothetical protein